MTIFRRTPFLFHLISFKDHANNLFCGNRFIGKNFSLFKTNIFFTEAPIIVIYANVSLLSHYATLVGLACPVCDSSQYSTPSGRALFKLVWRPHCAFQISLAPPVRVSSLYDQNRLWSGWSGQRWLESRISF